MKKTLTILLALLSLILFVAGINFYMNAKVPELTRYVFTGLLIIDGLLYIGLILLKESRHILIRIGWIGLVVANLVLIILDNVGLADMAVILSNVAVLVLYIKIYRPFNASG